MSKLPTDNVQVLGYDFKIIVSSEVSEEELGRCDYVRQVIYLNDKQGPDSIRDALLHEIIHAITYLMGLKDEDSEEDFVTRISTGLKLTLSQNTSLIDWIFKGE
tara:strand:+ start:4849 stop:5160 length:312 start_codon:yes stop_codon:yes gene_type:complete